MTRQTILVVGIAAFCFAGPIHAQRPNPNKDRLINPLPPLQADLLAPLDASKLSVGASVLAKAERDWNNPDCRLRAGSIIAGHVIDLDKQTKQKKGSSLSIAFDQAQCGDSTTPFQFILFALVATPRVDEGAPMNQNIDLFGAGGRTVGAMNSGRTAPPTTINGTMDMRAEMAARNGSASNMPSTISSGQVVGLRKVTLSVGTGPNGASVLSSPKDNIRLDSATQFVLIPRPTLVPDEAPKFAPTPETTTAKNEPIITTNPTAPVPELTPPPPPPPPPPEEIDETSICTDPCSMVPTDTDLKPSHASFTLSTKALGYIPHDIQAHTSFSFESTLSYLDAQNILFTYDPHKMRQRIPTGFRTETLRTMRAVLLDPAKLKIKRIVDWQIQGEGQYIWNAGPGRILVHLGHNLRLLGPNLEVLRQIPIRGQLVFVSISPSANHIAVGVLHERHNRALHDEISEATKNDPEEDVDIQLFDQNSSPLLTTRQNTSLPPPVLSDAGEIRVNAAGKNRWRIREFLWNHTEHTIATVTSECRPILATPLPDSVFIVGCDTVPSKNWYRMLRLDGHLILSGHGSSVDLEQCSASSQGDFAVRVVRAQRAKLRGESFWKRDLVGQEVSIYRSNDGKRLFFTSDPNVSLAQQSFAISPTGAQIAILSDVAISVYQVAKPTP